MAIYRRSRKPRTYKKKSYRKTGVSTAVKKYVKKTIRPMKPELKRYIDTYTETTIDPAVTPYYIYEPAVSQGNGPYQRNGSAIFMTGLHVRTMFKNNSTLTGLLRIIFVDTASDTDTAAATMELFQDTNNGGTPGTITASGTSVNNIVLAINKHKFKVHYDRLFKLGATGSVDGKDVLLFNKFFKLRSLVKHDANQTGQGNVSKRFLLIFLTTDAGLDAGGSAIEISGQNKWYFSDV